MNNLDNQAHLQAKLVNIKAQFADALLEAMNEKSKLAMKAQEYHNIISQIINILGLKDPSINELMAEVRLLVKNDRNVEPTAEQTNENN